MAELEHLRSKLTDEQQKILTAIWSYYRTHNQWIPVRLLHQNWGGKSKVLASLEQLGGAIVFEQEENGLKTYHLTFLGILLTEGWRDHEQLLTKYLAYVAQKCAEEPLRTQVTSSEVAADLKLDEGQIGLLGSVNHGIG